MKRILVLVVGCVLVSGTAFAGAHMGRVTSDALESLNKHVAAKKEQERDPASAGKTIKLMRIMGNTHRVENREGQKCADGETKPSPVVITYNMVAFDDTGTARLVSSSLEIQDCAGVAGPSQLYVLGDSPEPGEHRHQVEQSQLNKTDRIRLERMMQLMDQSPDCKVTLKVDKNWKITDMQGCKDNGG